MFHSGIVAAATAAATVVVRCVWRSMMAYHNMTTSDGNKASNTTGIIFTGNGTKKKNKQTNKNRNKKKKHLCYSGRRIVDVVPHLPTHNLIVVKQAKCMYFGVD